MTIKELKQILEKYPEDMKVEIEMWDGYFTIEEDSFFVMHCEHPQTDILMIDTTTMHSGE